jgi:hypothetical protein
LLELLGEAVERKVSLIRAPAGYGKSTLLAQWLQAQDASLAFAWISLDEQDNDPVRMWRHIVEALHRVAPEEEVFGADNGWEFDLRVKLPDRNIVEPPAGSLTSAPFVHAPRDSSSDLFNSDPVETVIIGSQAANGTYKVIANNPPDPSRAGGEWNPSWTGSQASVQMYNGTASLGGGLKEVPSTCDTKQFWYVGKLTKSGTSYTWTNKNICTNTAP